MKNRRQTKGNKWILAGFLLIEAALILSVGNVCESYQAGKKSEEITERLRTELPATEMGKMEDYSSIVHLYPDMQMPETVMDGNAYIGILEIPALSLTLPVLSEWSYPNLRLAPCRYRGSAYTGNLILAAHNYDTHFGRLSHLKTGETVRFTDMDGMVFSYETEELELLSPEDVETMQEGKWDLTLFTCTVGGKGRAALRCKLLDADETAAD